MPQNFKQIILAKKMRIIRNEIKCLYSIILNILCLINKHIFCILVYLCLDTLFFYYNNKSSRLFYVVIF